MRVSAPRIGQLSAGDAGPPARLAHAVRAAEDAARALYDLAEAAADGENRRHDADRQALTRDSERRRTHANALLDAATDRVRLDISDLLGRSPRYSHAPWDAPVWDEPYDEPVETPRVVQAATLGLAGPHSIVELPFVLPTLGANVVITHATGGRAPAHNLAQAFVTRALASALPGSLRVHLLDAGGLGQNLGILSRVPEPLVSGGVRATHEEISAELSAVRDHVHRLNSRVLLGDDDSLVKRWQTGTAQGIACTLVFAAGVDTGMHADDAAQLWALARTGNRCGVGVVAVIDTGRDLPPGVDLTDLTDVAEHIHVDHEGGATWESSPPTLHHNARLRCPNPPGSAQHRFLATTVAPAAQRGSNRPVHLADILATEEPGTGRTLTSISAPVGVRADGTTMELGVGDDESVAIGGIIVGPSGSGKTTLLHGLIHALAHRYSPDELEMYLLDMKAGVEFAEYATRPDRPAMPHVRVVGIEADATFALGVLKDLSGVDAERKQLFKEASLTYGQEIKNIAEYRDVTGQTLPRILFVVDEFQLMLTGPTEDAAWDLLDVLAKQGRSQGIHLLLATQSLNSVGTGRGLQKASVFDQLELRVGLRCKPDELSNLFDRTVRERLDTGRRGSGVLNQARGDKDADQLFQAGMLGPDERRRIRTDVLELYGPDSRIRVSRGAGAVDICDVTDVLTATATPTIHLGAPVGVNPPLIGVPALAGDGRGLLMSCRDERHAIAAISAIMAGLAIQPGCRDAGFVVVDLLPDGIPARRVLDRLVTQLGSRIRTVTEADLDTLPDIATRADGPTFVAVLGMQYATTEVPYYSTGDDDVHPLSWLCGTAPSQSVFPLIWLDTPERQRALGPHGERLQLRADAGSDLIDTATFLGQRPSFPAARGRMWFHDLAGDGEPVLVDPLTIGADIPLPRTPVDSEPVR